MFRNCPSVLPIVLHSEYPGWLNILAGRSVVNVCNRQIEYCYLFILNLTKVNS
ncbi:hypothetical protein [Leptothermofonsia sp. ETS-13]|uniref:hypothetical protein n=1 Tax=Leptothermofonsia sp. ETS-13 TaxID=3035696 RepID=UPI003BA1B31C